MFAIIKDCDLKTSLQPRGVMGHWGKEKHFIRSNLYNEFWFIYVYISLRTKKSIKRGRRIFVTGPNVKVNFILSLNYQKVDLCRFLFKKSEQGSGMKLSYVCCLAFDMKKNNFGHKQRKFGAFHRVTFWSRWTSHFHLGEGKKILYPRDEAIKR